MAKDNKLLHDADSVVQTDQKQKKEIKKLRPKLKTLSKKIEKKKTKEVKKIEKKKTKDVKKTETKKTKDVKKIETKKTKEVTKIEKKKTKEVTKIEKKKTKKIETKKTKEVTKIEKKKTKKELEEEQKTLEEELEEQLTDDEIVNFQIEKTNMEKLTHKVCEILEIHDSKGLFQSDLWKKLKVSSRDGSRLALRLERLGIISRDKVLEKGRWTYKLVLEKTPVSTQSIEGAPCLTCPVEQKCSIDGEISPKTCTWIEDWVLIQTSTKKKS